MPRFLLGTTPSDSLLAVSLSVWHIAHLHSLRAHDKFSFREVSVERHFINPAVTRVVASVATLPICGQLF